MTKVSSVVTFFCCTLSGDALLTIVLTADGLISVRKKLVDASDELRHYGLSGKRGGSPLGVN